MKCGASLIVLEGKHVYPVSVEQILFNGQFTIKIRTLQYVTGLHLSNKKVQ